jgi:hypothetical protein
MGEGGAAVGETILKCFYKEKLFLKPSNQKSLNVQLMGYQF